MIDFIAYVVAELKSRRLSKENALDLIRQFSLKATAGKLAAIHPLLQRNVSDIYQQCYSASFSGEEFFLRDHQVVADGEPVRVLPGVAYLEMARAALADALPDAGAGIRLDDVVWLKPVVVQSAQDLFVALTPAGADGAAAGALEFEIFSLAADGENEVDDVVHCRGTATRVPAAAAATLDLAALRARMQAGVLEAAAVYPAYQRMGMRFGPAHQAVERVYRGTDEVLALLELPAAVDATLDDYTWHPSLLDAALQSAVGLLGDLQQLPSRPSLPFALLSIEAFSACRRRMHAWIRHAPGSRHGDKVTHLDIDLCDEAGTVCVSLRGFSSRSLTTAPAALAALRAPAYGMVMATPAWIDRAAPAAAADSGAEQHVLLCALPDLAPPQLQALLPRMQLQALAAQSDGTAERFADLAVRCFQWLAALIERKPAAGLQVRIVIADTPDSRLLTALSGLLKSVALEQPDVRGQIVLVDAGIGVEALAACLQAESGQTADAVVRHAAGARQVPVWQELAPADGASAFKDDGVYLITGGLGGLGRLFATAILRDTSRARVILTGRAAFSPALARMLEQLAGDAAARLDYRSLDLGDAAEVAQLIAALQRKYRRIDGILHAAGMTADNFIAKKTAVEFAGVLLPKVFGAVNLDLASRALDLDFIALFSSGAAVHGNVGQADYAVANGFLDQFADYRNRLVAAGQRKGRTLSINWPLWRDGGMRMPERDQQALRETSGMHPLQTANGIAALQRALRAGAQQAVVIEGELDKIHGVLFAPPASAERAAPALAAAVAVTTREAAADLAEQTRDYLRAQFADLFKLPAHKIDVRAPLEKYGIDSILAMDLTRQLEKTFGALSKTLLFEHQSIDELAAYFLRAHAPRLGALFAVAAPSPAASAPPPAASAPPPAASAPPPQTLPATTRSARGRSRLRREAAAAAAARPRADEPIAIVGLSGRYPEAPDLDAFWANLRDGKDCIVEIPKERWDWRDYYSEDRTTEGAHYSKWGGFISGVDEFDPLFFNIPPVDAEFIDPQERLFLQHAWMAIEDAGYTRAGLQRTPEPDQVGQVGVYVGVMYGEYQLFGAESSLLGRRVGVPVSYASIANRVSYLFNLHGPSMTLDTMCSSSLTAIHLACQDLKQGRTHLAIAGGVNVTIHPNKYLILSAGQYISGDGHCQSFGEGGDGYIPGEGVGAVLLKRLSDAERDGNHIYGLLKGSALNHGGKTNGYSVPNPKAQASAVELALQEYGIDARQLSYIEAHGTGTRLGDPIEIAALSQVFRRTTDARQFCAIGSAKSNIGHCESAAGIAGLTKVLLQMKHGLIVPSLHSAVLNPYIDFDASPFVVNQTLRRWDTPLVDGRPAPRIAGISSFGAGGSNAHLIVEEYRAAPTPAAAPPAAVLLPLSARTAEQLRHKARDLRAFIERQGAETDLGAVAYTLQVGREGMDFRLALIVDTAAELVHKLERFVRGEPAIERCFHGQIEADRDSIAALGHDEDMSEAIGKWIARRKLAKLADLWVKGLDLDWRLLHAARTPALVGLPTYPFARDRYWISRPAARAALPAGGRAALHPLLHANTSDFFQQRYTAQFSGDEFFLADHQIGSGGDSPRKILPGVAYLEMIRAAVDLALPAQAENRRLQLRNVVWAQPLAVDGPCEVTVLLSPNGESLVDFEVTSAAAAGEEPLLHCQGQVEVADAARPEALDVAALRARMNDGEMAPVAVYAAFKAMGIHYGPSFQGVATIQRGHGELLAELALPAGAPQGDYVLHPSLLDSALQASLGLVAQPGQLPEEPSVPFALDSLVQFAPCAARMLAYVRDTAAEAGGLRKLDIDLCDVQGQLCARLSGLALRTVRVGADGSGVDLLVAQPVWETVPAAGAAIDYRRHQVLLCDLPALDTGRLAAAGFDAEHLLLPEAARLAERYREAALACFGRLQALLQASSGRTLFQLVASADADGAVLAGLAGLLDTARLENPHLVAQLLLVERDGDAAALAALLRAAQSRPGETLLRAERSALSGLRWQRQTVSGNTVAFKDRGVYLITGGLGGLGLVFAREIFRRCAAASVVLTGRGEADAARLDALAASLPVGSGRLAYRRLDLDDAAQVQSLVAALIAEFGALDGVIHSAGMVRDGFILKKSAQEFTEVLAPKVAGTVHLDLATQHLALDFLALFSSVASALGNVGQADYAAANGFLDHFAVYRNGLVDAGRRRGRTVAINWPLWEEGGMQLDADTRELLARASGMLPMTTESGLRAFHHSIERGAARVLVMEGDVARLQRALLARHAPVVAEAPAETAAPGDLTALLEKTQRYLAGEFASLLRMPPHEVDAKAPLEKYGMDSVLAMKLTNQLERSFGSLSKTLFFEYQTIASLAAYLVKAFPAALRERTGSETVAATLPTTAALPVHGRLPLRSRPRAVAAAAGEAGDIAIVGLAGRYPQAADLGAFWQNLKDARDCISEIPPERWDHAAIFHPARNQPGRAYSKWGGFLADVDRFDALFFNISPKEAELIDPQERLFLETVWETIEDAGYSKDAIARQRVGVYVGVMWGQYELYGATAPGAGAPSSSFASIANRVSYFFNFQGPSIALDTMCSSSLTAIHLASEEVRRGGIDVAIAGGVNVSIHPHKYLSLSQGNFASTDGRCRSFGEGGDGYVPGEGVGAVLLKPLAAALRDGDQIYALIKASAINHGGKTNGYTVPNPVAQADLIAAALTRAGITPASVDYLETHGTGTSLGDPIEIAGLTRAFDGAAATGNTLQRQSCPIGSVKSNIGHLESAAGIAALTKVLLQFKHAQLVPSLHAQQLNPHIDFAASAFFVQRTLADWPQPSGRSRRAGISSFGAGGANAHLILEQYAEAAAPPRRNERPEAFLLSARTRASLLTYAQRMADFLDAGSVPALADIAFTSQVGRTALQERLVVVAASTAALRDKLRQWLHNEATVADARGRRGAAVAVDDIYDGSARDAAAGAGALIDGDAGRVFLQLTLEQRDLARLAKLWISGVEIDWAALYRTERPRRVSLPTYPFVRERYWIDASPLAAAAEAASAPHQLLYYRADWQPAAAIEAAAAAPRGPLLLLGADAGQQSEWATLAGASPLLAVDYAADGDGRYRVDPRNAADFGALVATLEADGALPATVIQVLDAAPTIAEQLDRGLYALHFLCVALLQRKLRHPLRILCVYAHEDAHGALLHQALAAYLKSLALENPRFSGKVVAVRGGAPTAEVVRLCTLELDDAAWRDGEVRYLGTPQAQGYRARREVKRVQRYRPAPPAVAGPALKHNGVYLVSGGLGGLGRIFSEHLAARYAARLVLTGRSAPDEAVRAQLAALQLRGAEAIYVQADVADAEQAEAVALAARQRFGRINGVIHSAGIHRDAFALYKTRNDMQTVLAAKVLGALHLDQATRDDDLDLFVLFSSVAGALGNPGQCDYAFANGFLDAFAEQRQALVETGLRCGRNLSIDWPYWEDGGMRMAQSNVELTLQRSGIAALPSEAGLRCWETLLRADAVQALALYGDAARIDAYLARRPLASTAVAAAAPAEAAAAVVVADAVAPLAAAEAYLKQLLGAEIKLPPERIDAQERFESFGVDSMMIARLNASLERDLGELPKTLFYEYTSIEELAAYLVREVGAALDRHLRYSAAPQAAALPVPAAVPAPVERTPTHVPVAHAPVARAALAPMVTTGASAAPVGAIAIVGLHGRFPQSPSLDIYWDNLRQGRDLTERVPPERWDAAEFFDADPDHAVDGKIYCDRGGFITDHDRFDAAFFGVGADEARVTDPQERLFLQSVWAAIEDAGYTRDSLKLRHPKAKSANVGVFVGVTTNTYHLLAPEEWQRGNAVTPSAMPWSIANRVSYFFDFQGPSMPVDSACSSSLAAIHLACESLQRQECQLAVAGGVNLYLHPAKYQSLCRRRMLALDGKCRSFGAGDDGFIPGEGVGTVVLKPLQHAIADGDHVYAIVAASACEHAGRANGYSSPNPNAQAQLIEQVLDRAGIGPEDIGYVEGHGTGTQLGDSLEVVALTQAFRKRTSKNGYCALGSVKANVGHAEAAAGIAGVAKLLLQFKHGRIAPTIHSETANPNIDFVHSPFYLQHAAAAWPADPARPRRALINSFGAGGVNACLVLQSYDAPAPAAAATGARHLVVLSARDGLRLGESAAALREHLAAAAPVDLGRLAYTLQVGREALPERLAVVVASADELSAELGAYAAGASSPRRFVGRVEPHQRRKSLRPEQREQVLAEFGRGEFDRLAQRWTQGQDLPWDAFHAAARPQRVPLPTYPFARERHWVNASAAGARLAPPPAKSASLHPLVSHNASTLREIGFVSSLSGRDYYGRDHVVNGESFFPGAGFLEIACVNATIAGEAAVTRIEDAVWMQPLRLGSGEQPVKTFLRANGNSAEYVIVSFNEDNERVLHAEGRVVFGARSAGRDARRYAIADLQRRASRQLSGEDCYRQLAAFGFHYGPSFRTIRELHVGDGFALSRLELADAMRADFDQYLLHPCLIDGALQTVVGVASGGEDADVPHLPFALDALEIRQPLAPACYACVEYANAERAGGAEIKQFNICLLNDNGDVLVRLDNFYVRALRSQPVARHQGADLLLLD